MRHLTSCLLLVATAAAFLAPAAGAVHFHNNCAQASGGNGDVPTAAGGRVTVGLDYFQDAMTNSPATVIAAGQSVTWTWGATGPINNAYCHSVSGSGFAGTETVSLNATNGRIVPAGALDGLPLLVVAGPEFLPNPTNPAGAALSFTRVFTAPGQYPYACQEHTLSGMQGVVVVT